MTTKAFAEYFIISLPYVMGAVFLVGLFFRAVIYYTVRRHESFAREFEKRVNRFIEAEVPGKVENVSFYVLTKKLLERTYYEVFEIRDRMKRRKPDNVMSASDRVFLVRQGCAWLVKDILKQVKFLRWTDDNPKLLNITKATLQHNPCFNKVFGVIPMVGMNDLISILPGLFVVAGILGTFIGIAGGLQELGTMNLQDLENTKNIMDRFLHEISFAMKTSIAGIIFSLMAHVANVILSPERAYVSMIDRFESSLDLLWYRADNNNFPAHERPFDEHRDAVEALAEDALNKEIGKTAAVVRGA
ncbi:hypothetical protein AB1A81_05345 [Bdellovibrio bacteriovorus]|uniref:MotA/TolQ/ExbB proton channel domain-containing protein n=1 Tax=Bdellovibrio bacteriovorus (strain ATCC 15356 / DSM 50701 / NCIMB 9529 / HD100) TaxID=264462 RepID=Q6MNS0_BDEBA|nr:hypothetical protein [Bdellovibrio bacteriovorus]AHZ86390.1 hypothetical protein EP01_15820 [Bdellovibrio bacteriovorus]BEV67631.1 hypothetical protein Bb109J_c1051 [Bdellovibrio bacteriovorus]CAE79081.1 conserved hypothetical protein [Bdellovibrio bacteriovorus HD100]